MPRVCQVVCCWWRLGCRLSKPGRLLFGLAWTRPNPDCSDPRRLMSLTRKPDHLEEPSGEDEPRITPPQRPRRSPPSGSPPAQRPTRSLQLPQQDASPHSVPFQKPSIVTTFSYTPDRELAFDHSALKYFVQPPLRADLGYRYDRWAKKPEEKGRLDNLLRAVARSGAVQSPSPFAGVVSWRGVMCKYATLFERIPM
jgi:hypothetical protein